MVGELHVGLSKVSRVHFLLNRHHYHHHHHHHHYQAAHVRQLLGSLIEAFDLLRRSHSDLDLPTILRRARPVHCPALRMEVEFTPCLWRKRVKPSVHVLLSWGGTGNPREPEGTWHPSRWYDPRSCGPRWSATREWHSRKLCPWDGF